MIFKRSILAVLAVVALVPGAAFAQSKTERAAIVQKLVDCKKVTEDAARLACYDQATSALDQAEAKGDVVIVDREQARKVRRQAFGFSLPSLSLFEKGEDKEEVANFDGVVAAARQNSAGAWVIKLEDGAVWAQNQPEELFKSPKPGSKVRIRKAALGSYMMTVDNGGGFKAHRVE
jgi:hypothetical protein